MERLNKKIEIKTAIILIIYYLFFVKFYRDKINNDILYLNEIFFLTFKLFIFMYFLSNIDFFFLKNMIFWVGPVLALTFILRDIYTDNLSDISYGIMLDLITVAIIRYFFIFKEKSNFIKRYEKYVEGSYKVKNVNVVGFFVTIGIMSIASFAFMHTIFYTSDILYKKNYITGKIVTSESMNKLRALLDDYIYSPEGLKIEKIKGAKVNKLIVYKSILKDCFKISFRSNIMNFIKQYNK